MILNIALSLIPIQNLLSLAELIPKLHKIGVRNVEDAQKLVARPDLATRMLTPSDLTSIDQAVAQIAREQAFNESFNWDLISYSQAVQADFAGQAIDVFDPAFAETRLVYLSIPTRTLRALESAKLDTVGDVLRAQPDLLGMRNLGERSVGELFRIMGQFARVYRYMLGNLWSVTQRRLTPPGLVKVIIGPLKDRERDVIKKRYGLEGRELTLRETGEALGISRERARQIQNRTMEKLREGSSLALIHDWVDLHLPHIVHRTMIKLGGLSAESAIRSRVSTTGFSLELIADILGITQIELFERIELVQVGDKTWAINRPFSKLCWDAIRAIRAQPATSDFETPTDDLIDAIEADFTSKHAIGKAHRPGRSFLRLVLRFHDGFWREPKKRP